MCETSPTLSGSYLYSILTDRVFKGQAVEAQAFDEPSQVGKCNGLVVKVTDITEIKNANLHYRIIYSTNMFYLRAKHGDRKRKTGREKKTERVAVEIATPITIS